MPPRPPHPVPNVDDVRNAPLWDGTVRISELIWVRPEEKYFCKRGWTSHFGKHEVICPSGKISGHTGWVEPVAKPITVQKVMGIASLHPSYALGLHTGSPGQAGQICLLSHLPLTSCINASCCDFSRVFLSSSSSATRFPAAVMASAAVL